MKNLLMIGDSIYRGYRKTVQRILESKVKVLDDSEFGTNSRSSIELLDNFDKNIEPYLKDADIIHFNCGLHDVMFFHWGDLASATPKLISFEEYEENIKLIIKKLSKYNAMLIWASSTPIIEELHIHKKQVTELWDSIPGRDVMRYNKDIIEYNAAAYGIVSNSGIAFHDLYKVVVNTGIEKCLWEDGIHLNVYGQKILGEAVANRILGEVK